MDTWTAWSAGKRIVYRYPLVDRRIIEFILGLPPDQLFGNGRSRNLAHAALEDILPPKVSKFDIANEEYRTKVRLEGWLALAAEASKGAFDPNCDWLDMPALQRSLAEPRVAHGQKEIAEFAEICVAIQVWHLFQRARS